MRKLLSVAIALIGLTLIAVDADARRMSGGRSIGKQRQAISPQQAAPRTPAQQQQAAPGNPAQQQAAPTTPPAQQPSGMSRWLGPLAGLAIGAGLASLFLNNGLAGALGGLLVIAALVAGAMLLFRLLRGGRAAVQPLRYAGAGALGGRDVPAPGSVPSIGGAASAAPHSVAAATRWPADFDADQFVRHARLNFVNLQAAYDRRDLTAIRDFLASELYKEIEADMQATPDAPKSEIVTLNAEVLDVASEDGLYVVSVRFHGLIREGAGRDAEPFSEIWHLEKPLAGRSGWIVSGIQQA